MKKLYALYFKECFADVHHELCGEVILNIVLSPFLKCIDLRSLNKNLLFFINFDKEYG